MRPVDTPPQGKPNKKRRVKSPMRLIIFLVTIVVLAWMTFRFFVALQTGEPFRMFGDAGGQVKNFVVAGVDEDGYRTDLILFCQVDSGRREVNIIQVPRDTKIDNKRNDKKINSAYYSGFECLSNELYQVLGLRATDYATISFDGFCDIVDAIGGVEVDVPMRMSYTDPAQNLVIDLQPGKQKLDGEKAEMFMRFRKNDDGSGYPEGDVGRMAAQKDFYAAVMKKMLSPTAIFRGPALYGAIQKNSDTSFSGGEIVGLMKDVLLSGKNNIHIYTVPGEGRYIGGISYFVHNKAETKALVEAHFTMGIDE